MLALEAPRRARASLEERAAIGRRLPALRLQDGAARVDRPLAHPAPPPLARQLERARRGRGRAARRQPPAPRLVLVEELEHLLDDVRAAHARRRRHERAAAALVVEGLAHRRLPAVAVPAVARTVLRGGERNVVAPADPGRVGRHVHAGAHAKRELGRVSVVPELGRPRVAERERQTGRVPHPKVDEHGEQQRHARIQLVALIALRGGRVRRRRRLVDRRELSRGTMAVELDGKLVATLVVEGARRPPVHGRRAPAAHRRQRAPLRPAEAVDCHAHVHARGRHRVTRGVPAPAHARADGTRVGRHAVEPHELTRRCDAAVALQRARGRRERGRAQRRWRRHVRVGRPRAARRRRRVVRSAHAVQVVTAVLLEARGRIAPRASQVRRGCGRVGVRAERRLKPDARRKQVAQRDRRAEPDGQQRARRFAPRLPFFGDRTQSRRPGWLRSAGRRVRARAAAAAVAASPGAGLASCRRWR